MRAVWKFLFVLFGAGAVLYAVGLVNSGSELAINIAGEAPIPVPAICIIVIVLGALSSYAMMEEGTWDLTFLHIYGIPLGFIIGFGDLRPFLLTALVYALFAFSYLMTMLAVDVIACVKHIAARSSATSFRWR